MQRALRYKLSPTPRQVAALEGELDLHRALYNGALQERIGAWKYARKTVQYAEQNRALTLVRADDPTGYGARSSSAQQRTLRRLDRAYQAFFRRVKQGRGPAGFPRFRGRRYFNTVEFTAGNGARLTGNRVTFLGIGAIKLRLYRPLPDGAVPKQIGFTRTARGWWVVIVCDLPDLVVAPRAGPVTAIDVGLRHYVMAADGTNWDAPRPYEAQLAVLRRAQRAVARKQRGSNRRGVAVQKLAVLHERIANARLDFQRKLAVELCARFAVIGVEDLDIARMVQSDTYPWARRGLNRGMLDAAFAQFIAVLRLRAERDGVQVIACDPRDSSQLCSGCGTKADPPITIFDRFYQCRSCGLRLDQDENSALVLAQNELVRLADLKQRLRGIGSQRTGVR